MGKYAETPQHQLNVPNAVIVGILCESEGSSFSVST